MKKELKNKTSKAFTLIELLAVIIVIGMLLAIAIPAVTRYLQRGKTSYYTNLEETTIIAGRDYLSDYRTLLPREIGNVTVIEGNELLSNNYIDRLVDENGEQCETKVTVKKTSKNEYEYYSCLICPNYQTSGENCEYTEDDNVTSETKNYSIEVDETLYTVNQGENFEVPYARAYYLGELVSSSVAGSPRIVDTNKLGTTVITYSYEGAKSTIRVVVIDNQKPTSPEVVLRYDDKDGNIYGGNWYSGNIYEEFKSTDYTKPGLSGSGVSTYEFSTDGTTFLALSGNNHTSTTNGDHIYYIRSVDNNGNTSSESSYNIKIDKEFPSCEVVATGTKGTDDWFTTDVSFSLKNTETVSGVLSSVISATTLNSNTTSQTINGSVIDRAGNTSSCKLTVKVDKTIPATPTITANDSVASGNWHTADTTLTLSGSSSTSGITYYIDTNSNPTTQRNSVTIDSNTASTTYYAKACNGAGTCSSVSSYVLRLDKTAPTVPVLTGGSSSWVTSTRTISVSTASTAVSGINTYEYYSSTSSTTPSTTTSATGTTSNSITISTQGERYIYYRAVSNSGLKSSWSSYEISRYDSVSPSATTSRSGKVTTMTLTDNIGVVKYGVGTSSTTAPSYTTITSTTSTSRTYTASTWGTYYIWVQDNSGNTTVNSFTVPSSAFNYTATQVSSTYAATPNSASYTASKSTYTATRTCSDQFVGYTPCCPNASGCPYDISMSAAYGTNCYCNCNTAVGYCYPTATCTVTQNVCSYSCPYGGSLSSSTCTTYSCNSSSHSLSGSTCRYTYYTCPNGGTASSSTCYYSYYTCPNGGTLNGTTCEF